MNAPRPERVPQVPLAEVLGEAVALYGRNASMFITVAVAGALAGNLAGLVMSPSAFVAALIWSQIIAALITGLQAPVWLFAVLARKGEPLTGGVALYGVVTLLPRFFSVGLVLGVGGGALLLISYYVPVLALPALPILIYFAVRFSLSGAVAEFALRLAASEHAPGASYQRALEAVETLALEAPGDPGRVAELADLIRRAAALAEAEVS